ncbi:MAG: YceD family protein [Chlamydiales bacterium]
MEDEFKIYVEQLREGHENRIDEVFSPDFLEINEPDLAFLKPVKLQGVAYIAEKELILNWNIWTEALVPCAICNEKVPVEIEIDNFYYSEPLDAIKSGIFNFKSLLRETILLEVPLFTECNQGNCPSRKEVAQYLRKPSEEESDEGEGYHPFADL